VRAKVRSALIGSLARGVPSDPAAVDAYLDTELGFAGAGTYGGNSSCVEIESPGSEEIVVCDAGSGMRELGVRLLERRGPSGLTVNLLLSHPHWDHIMGNTVRIYGCHDSLERVLRTQNSAPFFPVDFSALRADIEFHRLEPGRTVDIAGLRVTASLQRHGGDSYGYRFEHGGRSVVYSTDGEHKLEQTAEIDRVIDFFRGADLVIFDAMYSLADAISIREDWGHSSNLVGVDLCLRAGVRHYCMFHHEPRNDDAALDRILAETRRYEEISRDGKRLRITSAYDGLEIAL
jgi:phosphoribosyl 1,2-cyclic phosphodiesterase